MKIVLVLICSTGKFEGLCNVLAVPDSGVYDSMLMLKLDVSSQKSHM